MDETGLEVSWSLGVMESHWVSLGVLADWQIYFSLKLHYYKNSFNKNDTLKVLGNRSDMFLWCSAHHQIKQNEQAGYNST